MTTLLENVRRATRSNTSADIGNSPSKLIDQRITELQDWRGKVLAHVRAVIAQSDPRVVEEWKWNVPVWSCHGIICTGETYKKVVKLTFPKGAKIADPSKLFNSSLEGNARRAIDIAEGVELDDAALSTLIRSAIRLNEAVPSRKSSTAA